MSIVFFGGGNLAQALVGGLLAHGQPASEMRIVDIDAGVRSELQSRWGIAVYPSFVGALDSDASTMVLAVKPQQMEQLVSTFPALPAEMRVISVAAGIPTDRLSCWLGGHSNIVRAMPNTPALIQQGASGLYAMPAVSQEDRLNAQSLMRAVGSSVWVEQEWELDVVTAVSGSGPAYVFLLMEAMCKAARDLGLDAGAAEALVLDTVKGAALLAGLRSESPEALRRRVTSPGGTTEAAVRVLMDGRWPEMLNEAISAAACRSRELGAMTDSGGA